MFSFHRWVFSYSTTFIHRLVSSAGILVIHPHSLGNLAKSSFLVLPVSPFSPLLSIEIVSVCCIFLVMIHYYELTASPKFINSLIVKSGIYIPVFMLTYYFCSIWPYWVLSSSLNSVILALITFYKEATGILFIKLETSGSSEVSLFGT